MPCTHVSPSLQSRTWPMCHPCSFDTSLRVFVYVKSQADIAHPVTVKMHARKRQVAPRAFAGRGANIYTYVGLPDDVAYSRRMTRASSVPPRPILSAADYDYVPRPARRLEVLGRRVPPCLSRCLTTTDALHARTHAHTHARTHARTLFSGLDIGI